MKQQKTDKKSLSFPEKILYVFFEPGKFFTNIESEGMKPAFVYHAIISFIFLLLNMAVFFILSSSLVSRVIEVLGVFAHLGFIAMFVVLWILLIIGNIVIAAIYHIFVRSLGGKHGFSATYKAVSYAFTPGALLGWIPIIGILVTFQFLYLNVRGVSVLHKISIHRAFWALLLPIIVAIIVFTIFSIGLLLSLLNAGTSGL